MTHHGSPCWYELSTMPGKLAEAGEFYAKVLGWTPGQSLDMGAMGTYDLFRWQDRDPQGAHFAIVGPMEHTP